MQVSKVKAREVYLFSYAVDGIKYLNLGATCKFMARLED